MADARNVYEDSLGNLKDCPCCGERLARHMACEICFQAHFQEWVAYWGTVPVGISMEVAGRAWFATRGRQLRVSKELAGRANAEASFLAGSSLATANHGANQANAGQLQSAAAQQQQYNIGMDHGFSSDSNAFVMRITEPPSVEALARALFATDERVERFAFDRGEFSQPKKGQEARFQAVIAKAWDRGVDAANMPEFQWRLDAELRAARVAEAMKTK
jgi:hypothetical protein